MKWLPAWLGEAYCVLFPREGTLTVKEAADALGTTQARATLILSRLEKAGWVERVERGRYRTMEPAEVFRRIAILREIEKNLAGLPQREFLPPIRRFMELIVRHYGDRLLSAALFGSVARGNADPSSDIDILLIIRGLPKGIGERYREISEIELRFYETKEHWLLPSPVSPLLYTPEEAVEFHAVYLDMTRHLILLLDRGGLLTKKLAELSARLQELEAERYEVEGKPVWVLAPHLRRGEEVAL